MIMLCQGHDYVLRVAVIDKDTKLKVNPKKMIEKKSSMLQYDSFDSLRCKQGIKNM